ncbi:hypothetical protein [Brevibacterium litoralis]|uniref:hypothetical protein n=1 Tax=Brevibacterium litoralis TaxID=3138935 RepID=UPI0032ECD031
MRNRDSGSASVEFVFVSVVLLVPIVYLVVALAQIQAASFATTAAAVTSARAAARFPTEAQTRAQAVTTLHFDDHGVDPESWSVSFTCDGPCAEPGSLVTAHIETEVAVPGTPVLFGGSGQAPHVTVRASHTDRVAPYTHNPADLMYGQGPAGDPS